MVTPPATDIRVPSAYAGELAGPWRLMRCGRVRQANADLAQLQRTRGALTTPQQALHAALLMEGRLAVGDMVGAAAAADPLGGFLGRRGTDGTAAHLGLGELAAALGDHATAYAHFATAGELPELDTIRPWRTGAALALVRMGRRREAADVARQQAALAAQAPHAQAHGLRALAIAETGNDPIGTLRSALRAAQQTPDRRLAAQLGADIAGLMLLDPANHATEDAVALLRETERYAAAEGLWPLHSRVARQLERAGEHSRPVEDDALSLLTAAEIRVARLAAGGLTNREIAAQLAVTIKGVEWHLSRVYRKLGIGSREGLPALFDSDTLAG
jgi:DNA-binding NarL/FixJ family response regulator